MANAADIRAAVIELVDGGEVRTVRLKRSQGRSLDVVIEVRVSRDAAESYLEAMVERATERRQVQDERHLDALHEVACG